MNILCRVAGHKAVPSNIWNDGYYFSRCKSCGCEMIGRGGLWQPVPRGYRVVWRPRSADMPDWNAAFPIEREAGRLTDMLLVKH